MSLLELLDIYTDLSDRQNEIIISLTKIIKKQRYEIEQLKGLEASQSYEKDPPMCEAEDLIKEHENL